ncbi:hypothetical protein D9M70_425940 [compost metagenome]
MRPTKGIDVRSDHTYRVRIADGLAVAECSVRYWSPINSAVGRPCSVLPQLGNFQVAIDAETNQLISAECNSSDGATVLATISAESLEDIYESAGVRLSFGGTNKATKALGM